VRIEEWPVIRAESVSNRETDELFDEIGSNGHETVLAALALEDDEPGLLDVDVAQLEAACFALSQAGFERQPDEGSVSVRLLEETNALGFVEDVDRRLPLRAWVADPAHDVVLDAAKIVPEPVGTRGYDDLRRAATREPLGQGVRPSVASPGDLARMLGALGREVDLAPLRMLHRVIVLERERARGWER
jgi:hypothetical protein